MHEILFKIIIGLVGFLVFCGSLFGFLVIRLIRGYDEKITDLFKKTEDLPAIRCNIEWIKNKGNKKK